MCFETYLCDLNATRLMVRINVYVCILSIVSFSLSQCITSPLPFAAINRQSVLNTNHLDDALNIVMLICSKLFIHSRRKAKSTTN